MADEPGWPERSARRSVGRGIVYATALSHVPDALGQSFLAVGGYGVEQAAGDSQGVPISGG